MMGFSGLCIGEVIDNDDPTPEDIGRFIPQSKLQTWWAYMQRRYPQIFPASDPCPDRQWPKDTKIRTYFDGDRSKEMNAIILGSKMKVEQYSPTGEEYPMYVVRCPPGSSELSYIHLTEAHEEDGWEVVEEGPTRRGNTSLPSPEVIKIIALEYNYEERRDEASSTLFFKDTSTTHNPTLINVFYTTGGIMTKLSHPRSGYNQLWRTNAFDSVASLAAIFENPRVHTGKGYRNAGNAVRGCVNCGEEKKRCEFSNNQWRKGQGESKCTSCVQSQRQGRNPILSSLRGEPNEIEWESIIDSIICDAEGCCNTSPAFRCEKCCMVYYCSEACRRRHQREHSQECMDVNVMRSRCQMSGSDPNLRSGLCNASPSTLSQMRGRAMATQLSGNRSVDSLLLQAEYIHQADKNWEEALELYHSIMMASYEMEDHRDMATPSQWRQIYMGFSRCCFALAMYDKCISAGSAAVEMNRHFPQVHRFVALAHDKKGDDAEARKMMKHAVLYEAPWCDETAKVNKNLLAVSTSIDSI
mmetsp:Transcript_14441/g.22277  ORF Transcript_14441/g.22277 Transcript_14441/m.22277 type:complete len:526 (+) Transcript_14441:113-1690(+)